jgi:hypothetical protein
LAQKKVEEKIDQVDIISTTKQPANMIMKYDHEGLKPN